MILDFGKYRGTDIEDVPLQYVIFLSGYKMMHTKRIRTDLAAYDWVKTNKSEVCEFAKVYLQSKCWHCTGNIVAIGSSRCNGAQHNDWEGRYLHKTCWKFLKKQEREELDISDDDETN